MEIKYQWRHWGGQPVSLIYWTIFIARLWDYSVRQEKTAALKYFDYTIILAISRKPDPL